VIFIFLLAHPLLGIYHSLNQGLAMSTHALTKAFTLRSLGTSTVVCAQVGMYRSFEDCRPSQHIPCKPANLEASA
jgi:hypothetical protein